MLKDIRSFNPDMPSVTDVSENPLVVALRLRDTEPDRDRANMVLSAAVFTWFSARCDAPNAGRAVVMWGDYVANGVWSWERAERTLAHLHQIKQAVGTGSPVAWRLWQPSTPLSARPAP